MATVTDKDKQQLQTRASRAGRVPALTPEAVHVWQVWLEQVEPAPDLLCVEELERANRFKRAADQERFVKTRGVLRQLLGGYCHADARHLKFDYNQHGKPSLQPSLRLKFNISHSDNLLFVALILDAEIGVDVEKIVADKDTTGIAERFFDEHEQYELARFAPEDKQAGFFSIWTKKEALVKAFGLGLWQPKAHPAELESWNVFNIQAPEGFAAAVAVEKPRGLDSVRYLQW